MRDTQYTLYIHQRYTLNGCVDGSWDSGLFVSLRSLASARFPRVFFFTLFLWNGKKSRRERSLHTKCRYVTVVRSCRGWSAMWYTAREGIRCNESRCYGRIKASRKLIRRIPIEYRVYIRWWASVGTQSKELRAVAHVRLQMQYKCETRCKNCNK